jgi:biotin carboxyl carrier protein
VNDIGVLLEKIKAEPYEEIIVRAPHCGTIYFEKLESGDRVQGQSGTWGEIPGTLLATLKRENNIKAVNAPQKGEIVATAKELDQSFVTAGTPIVTIRHYLTREEVLNILLQKALFVFSAPEKGNYYFVPEVDTRIRTKGCRSVKVQPGAEIFILSRMKRETQIQYDGPEGIMYSVFFDSSNTVEANTPLIGICPESQLSQVEDVVARVHSEWEEKE